MSAGRPGGIATFSAFSKPAGYVQGTGLSSVKGLADIGTIPADAKLVMVQAESQSVRWRDDGTNPSASVGMVIIANDILFYSGDFSAIKFIETTASAKLNITYYK